MFLPLLWSLLSSPTPIQRVTQPHIIVILADDLGWDDVSWNNPSIITPHLEALAREGVILNSAYTQPVCTPSRASLMTGDYPFRMGMQHGILKKNNPYGLPLNYTLLPQKLKTIGYKTHMVGKWHLGFCKWEYTPTYRGFDSFYGFYGGHIDYYTHKTGKENGLDFRHNRQVLRKKWGKYSTELFSDHASEIIQQHDTSKPLFMYLPFQNPHAPKQVPKKYLKMYEKDLRNEDRRTHSAMVTAMDAAVGKILESLVEKGMLNNTVIIFLSDNGASPRNGGSNWPLRGAKSTLWEGGTRVPAFVWSHMLRKKRYTSNEMIHVVDWFPTILELAGETPDPHLSGVSQLGMLNGKGSARNEFVYNIDDVTGRAAIRVGPYKLIEGSPGAYNKWYALPRFAGKRPQMDGTNRRFANKTQLYDVQRDQSETFDLSWKMPHVVRQLQEKLQSYRQNLIPAHPYHEVKKAHPKFHNGIWSPGWC